MAIFDPAAVNKQIDAFLATVPPGKRVTMIGAADLINKKISASVMVRMTDSIGAYVRVSKTFGSRVEADAGIKASFLYDAPDDDLFFSYSELVALFKDRGQGWIKAHFNAYKLLRGGEVEL